METTIEYKARCLVKDLGRAAGIKYAEKSIGNREYLAVAAYIRQHSDEAITAYRGGN